MNEYYGPLAKQIFDLAHRRHPVSFSYPSEGTTRAHVIGTLGREVERIIRDMIVVHGPKGSKIEQGLARFSAVRDAFEDAVRNNNFYDLDRKAAAIAITIVPPTGTRFAFKEIYRQHSPPAPI